MFQEDEYKYSVSKLKALLDLVQVMVLVLDKEGKVKFINPKGCEILGFSEEEILGKDWFSNFLPEEVKDEVKEVFKRSVEGELEPVEYYENPVLTKGGERKVIAWHNSFLRDESGNVVEVISAGEDVTELRKNINLLKSLYSLGNKLVEEGLDFIGRAKLIAKACVEDFGAFTAFVGWAEPDRSVKILASYPENHPYLNGIVIRWDEGPHGMGPSGRAIRTGSPQVIEDVEGDPYFAPWRERTRAYGVRSVASFPMISRGKVYGVLTLCSTLPGFFTEDRVSFFQTIANMGASSLENARLFEESQRKLRMLQALRNIDRTILGSLDSRLTMRVVLNEIINQLGVDAVSIYRFDPWSAELEFSYCEGSFITGEIKKSCVKVGEGIAGGALLENRVLWLEGEEADDPRSELLKREGFKSYFVVPLISKGKKLGVLEIFKREPISPTEEWIGFLETLAGQLAIAIDNMELLRDLELTNMKLIQAYDATIESWAKVLELRDMETKGHSERVTELTLRISKRFSIGKESLVHVRRGALLHDIGKLAIPDSILFKPGPLTEEEWEIMKKHPVYAYELLSKIEYLRPALDIPYYHHERWDGRGYPRGLKGEEIPLPARIFAVVDVYDALTSDRPYRKAWTKEKAISYIMEGSGSHFDPRVVKAFLEVLREM